MGTILIHLALKEPGDNVVNEKFNGIDFEAPREWLSELPTQGECESFVVGSFYYISGIWELVYQTPKLEGAAAEKAGRGDCAKPELRKQIAEKASSSLIDRLAR